MNIPSHLKYTKEHEWAKIDGSIITVGITDHAQSALGDIVYLELPKVGRELKLGETFGVVESIKAVSDLYAPVSGKVVEINTELAGNPAQINQNPYESSWMVKIEVSTPPDHLLDASAYQAHVKSLS